MIKDINLEQIKIALQDIQIIKIDNRKITASDIASLTNKQVIEIFHRKGFLIRIHKAYIIDQILGIPTIMYSVDQYQVEDELLGVHSLQFNYKEMADYVNGLLGY